jgi:hypothetical protein
MAEFAVWTQLQEERIRAGRIRGVRASLAERIEKRSIESLPRAQTVEVAALCRRTGLRLEALMLLHRVVRPSGRASAPATDVEKVEYAGSLAQIGAEDEALELLASVRGNGPPNALLFTAFAHFSRWEYDRAIPLLQRYGASASITPYQRLVGRVNLAASLVIERRLDEGDALIEELLASAPSEALLLRGNLLEIAAQAELRRRRLPRARARIEQAHELLAAGGGPDHFFVEKWRAILSGFAAPAARAEAHFEGLRQRAFALGQWETLRECDLYQGLALGQEAWLERAYFGTPFPRYRERVRAESGREFAAGHVDWSASGTGRKPKVALDLTAPPDLKPGQVVDRLLRTLASDFYRPQHWVRLHAQVFAGRALNPRSSATVMHQAIRRARQWLQTHASQVEIEERSSCYRLKFPASAAIRIPAARLTPLDVRLAELRASGLSEVSARQAAEIWNLAKPSALRLIQELQDSGALVLTGSGPATRYRLSR